MPHQAGAWGSPAVAMPAEVWLVCISVNTFDSPCFKQPLPTSPSYMGHWQIIPGENLSGLLLRDPPKAAMESPRFCLGLLTSLVCAWSSEGSSGHIHRQAHVMIRAPNPSGERRMSRLPPNRPSLLSLGNPLNPSNMGFQLQLTDVHIVHTVSPWTPMQAAHSSASLPEHRAIAMILLIPIPSFSKKHPWK